MVVDRAERRKLRLICLGKNTLAKEPFSLLPSSCKPDTGNVLLFLLLIYVFF